MKEERGLAYILTKGELTEDDAVRINKLNNTIVQFESEQLQKYKGLKLHTISTHNWYKKRRYLCPYCEILDWGDPVPKAIILEKLK